MLSNNDGCIIARSEKLKAEGIPMGAPYFKWREEIEEMGGTVLSSNYTLYGDMCRRVHSILKKDALELERCSIDEAFLTLPALKRKNLQRLADRLRRTVRTPQRLALRVHASTEELVGELTSDNGAGIAVLIKELHRRPREVALASVEDVVT